VIASPFGGAVTILAAMWLLFQATTALARPLPVWLSRCSAAQ
jgi:Fe2+ transport system protein B